MGVRKSSTTITVSLPNGILADLREVAGPRGVSALLTEAAEEHIRRLRLGRIADDIAERTGAYTESEMEWADRLLSGSQRLDDVPVAA